MIVLDTNVVSEAMKPKPDRNVQMWLDKQPAETLYLSSVTLAELLFGISILPPGQRKNTLTQALDGLLELFENRILAFDTDAARCYAKLSATVRSVGKGFPVPDSYIAAIAAAHNFIIATRDVAPFQAAGINVINPWETAL
ncbi:MAG: type II toxin-antitoxin system VapC family toxin [Methylobacillus sp.]|jgi:predicted nucleic acid-binding protein|nr:type II toxin-antitoxin system VapC family toxin [Methylobacillus sp.]